MIAFERNLLKSLLNIEYSSASSTFSAEPVNFRPANRQRLSRKCRQSLTPLSPSRSSLAALESAICSKHSWRMLLAGHILLLPYRREGRVEEDFNGRWERVAFLCCVAMPLWFKELRGLRGSGVKH